MVVLVTTTAFQALVQLLLLLLQPVAAVDANVTLRSCVNFMNSYAGSWLARADLVKDTNFEDKQALEFATRNLYNKVRGKRGTGWKTNDPVSDFLVLHLSGIEHGLVRRFGFEKGLAMTRVISKQAFAEVRDAAELAAKADASDHAENDTDRAALRDLARRTVAVVPFFSGGAVVNVTKDAAGHERLTHVSTVGSGGANTHTLADASLKYLQLSIVVSSIAAFVDFVVVGVVDAAEVAATVAFLRAHLPEALTAPQRLLVVDMRSAGFGAFLPYRLLRWVKKRNAAGVGGFLNGGGGGGGGSGGGGGGGGGGSEGKRDRHHHHSHHKHHKHHDKHAHHSDDEAGEGIGERENSGGNFSSVSSSVEPQEEESTAAAARPIGPFEFIYYSEADNILQLGAPESIIHVDQPPRKSKESPKRETSSQKRLSRSEVLEWSQRRRGRVVATLLSFLRSSDGLTSYVAPQRLENRGRMPPRDGSVLLGLEPVGQNKCQDERGARAIFQRAGTGSDMLRTDRRGIPKE